IVSSPGTPQDYFYQVMCEGSFFRIRYVNGNTAQNVFRLQAIKKLNSTLSEVHAINVPVLDNTDALVTKGIIYGKASNGNYVAVKTTPSGALTVDATISSSNLPTGAATDTSLVNIINKLSDNGQSIMANSKPVVIASDQTQIPVTFNWAGLTDTQLRANPLQVSGNFYQSVQPISVTTLPLPNGAALESGGNLSSIATELGAINETTASSSTANSGLNGLVRLLINKVSSLMTINQVVDGTRTQLTCSNFPTLASATYCASIDLDTTNCYDVNIEVEASTTNPPASLKQICVFIKVSNDGINFSSGPESLSVTTDESNLYLLGVLPLSTTATTYNKSFSVKKRLGRLPKKIRVILKNEIGVPLTSGNLYYSKDVLQASKA
ncbi:MAG: hypothetical protein PHC28_09325, partial [Flavobacterium sp.]|uniref:hypothetical protein n=1 Tax=Flavobacterium sp. TaxID=239 RepID=UPI00263966A9